MDEKFPTPSNTNTTPTATSAPSSLPAAPGVPVETTAPTPPPPTPTSTITPTSYTPDAPVVGMPPAAPSADDSIIKPGDSSTGYPESAPKSRSPMKIIGLIVLAIIVIGGLGVAGYYLGFKGVLAPTSTPAPTATPTPEPTPTPDPTADWKSYSNTVYNYTIKYPSDWELNTDKADSKGVTGAVLKFVRDDYEIVISWPSAYGPGGCIFSDSPDFGKETEGPITDCKGEYVEFGKTIVYRRLVKPDLVPSTKPAEAIWSVYTKDKSGNYVTVPPISYSAPLEYNKDTVTVMDQILSTYQSVEPTESSTTKD